MLTGESRHMLKSVGSAVYGGTTLLQGNIVVKVTKTAEDSSLNQIMKLVENAQSSKAPIQGFADKISNYFVPTIIILSIITWIVWFSVTFTTMKDQFPNDTQRFAFAF